MTFRPPPPPPPPPPPAAAAAATSSPSLTSSSSFSSGLRHRCRRFVTTRPAPPILICPLTSQDNASVAIFAATVCARSTGKFLKAEKPPEAASCPAMASAPAHIPMVPERPCYSVPSSVPFLSPLGTQPGDYPDTLCRMPSCDVGGMEGATPQPQQGQTRDVRRTEKAAAAVLAPVCPAAPLPQIPRSSFHVGYYVPPSVVPGDPYGGLEQVWQQYFELLFRNMPHLWFFGPAFSDQPSDWLVFKDMAKVRFLCRKCFHGWTSMYGLVVFHIFWDELVSQGHVRFSLTGQKCNQCSGGDFETPMWYPEEAQKVMTNLYHEVSRRLYGLAAPPRISQRRHGRPRQQHESTKCQGCHLGICKPHKATH